MSGQRIHLREAAAGDAEALALIGAATFLETFAEIIPGSDIVAHCTKRHAASVYSTWLADQNNALWLAETQTGAPIGYLVLTQATLPDEAPHPEDLEIQRIYALSRFHGSGIGYRLMQAAFARAEAQGARQLVLGVLKTNARAVSFYERQGFRRIGTRRFTVGRSVFDDLVMGRRCRHWDHDLGGDTDAKEERRTDRAATST